MSEWRPIETAPKDGTMFIIFQAEEDGDHWFDLVSWSETENDWIDDGGTLSCDGPTHWMPLPEPPSQ
jgi:hypothetical protein